MPAVHRFSSTIDEVRAGRIQVRALPAVSNAATTAKSLRNCLPQALESSGYKRGVWDGAGPIWYKRDADGKVRATTDALVSHADIRAHILCEPS